MSPNRSTYDHESLRLTFPRMLSWAVGVASLSLVGLGGAVTTIAWNTYNRVTEMSVSLNHISFLLQDHETRLRSIESSDTHHHF